MISTCLSTAPRNILSCRYSAYERPAELSFDVTDVVKKGRNVIGVRVSANCPSEYAEGFQGPLFLYAPMGAKAAQPAGGN